MQDNGYWIDEFNGMPQTGARGEGKGFEVPWSVRQPCAGTGGNQTEVHAQPLIAHYSHTQIIAQQISVL